eukprot:GHVP01033027.1.p1 GENE.GHVP01033027.1~~GHVP01033027.1.p1  ORF type:complete len:184 (-),score=41.11 GHVP01033027.1:115-666(-)
MARNAEKAMAMLNRWNTMKAGILSGSQKRRPKETNTSKSVAECESWRNQIAREVARKIAEVQNAGLGERRIREVNDEINRLLRDKKQWEERILELGGPDYVSGGGGTEVLGSCVTGSDGYRYFGAAKDLPGVRELFAKSKEEREAGKRTRAQILQNIQPDYYGWREDDRPGLLDAEKSAEMIL